MTKVIFDSSMIEKSKPIVVSMNDSFRKIVEICADVYAPEKFPHAEYIRKLPNLMNDYVLKLEKVTKWLNKCLNEYDQLEQDINRMNDKLEIMKINCSVFK